MFKKLFNKIKLKLMGIYVNKFLASIIEAFKTKSPQMFMVVAMIATVLQFGLDSVLSVTGIELPPDLLSLNWIIERFGFTMDPKITEAILWFLALLTGSSTTSWLSQEKKLAKIEDGKMASREVDITSNSQLTEAQRKTELRDLRHAKAELKAQRKKKV